MLALAGTLRFVPSPKGGSRNINNSATCEVSYLNFYFNLEDKNGLGQIQVQKPAFPIFVKF